MPLLPNIPSQSAIDAELTIIANKHLGFVDLETRNWDRMDFRELAVWKVKEALQAAFDAGRATERMARSIES